MQRLGFEVDPIYSVQVSNHTGDFWGSGYCGGNCTLSAANFNVAACAGYPTFRGAVFQGQDLQALITGLEENKITNYSHLLTGYIGSVSLLKMIVEVAQKLKAWNPGLTYGGVGVVMRGLIHGLSHRLELHFPLSMRPSHG